MSGYLWLVPVGFAVGTYGTLIGAGGGFVLLPLLLLLYPAEAPETLTSISLAVVFFNASSGSVAYARMGRIDYRSGLLLSAATVPGAVLGALTTPYIPRRSFDAVLGIVLIAASVFLFAGRRAPTAGEKSPSSGRIRREIVERDGTRHSFSYDPLPAVALSVLVGFFSSVLGIGGGILHVPVLVAVLRSPVHLATATSHFVLAAMALAGTLVHVGTGAFHHGVRRMTMLTAGVLVGAQVGAKLSGRFREQSILRGLAIGLAAIGVRLLAGVL